VVAAISVNPAAVTLAVGGTTQLVAVAKDENGNSLSNTTVQWTSSDTSVALVSDVGVVRARKPGKANVKAKAGSTDGSAEVVVNQAPVTSVIVSLAVSTLLVNQTTIATALLKDANGAILTGRAVAWQSSNATLATVSDAGVVTGVAAGSVSITAVSEGISGSSSLSVVPVPVASVAVTPASVSMLAGATYQLAATAYDANGAALGRALTWSSSDPAVASVSSTGLVSAASTGSAVVTVTSEGKSAQCAITVTQTAPVPVATVAVALSSSALLVGQSTQATATLRDASGNVLSGRTIQWTSSVTNVARVSAAGVVTAVSAGNASITATSETKSGTATVQVTAPPPPPPDTSTSGAIVLKAGDNIQSAVNKYPAGTTFRLTAGTYYGQEIRPKNGNQFYGEPGAILDGQQSTTYAFTVGGAPYPSRVRIHGLIIQNYNPPAQFGAVRAGGSDVSEGGYGWMIDSSEIRYNSTVGINIGNATRILGNNIHHNGQLGIGGAGDSSFVDGNEISYNNYQKLYNFGWEAGGLKIAVAVGSVASRNYVHDNWGPGIWYDIDCYGTLIEENRADNNADAGIFYEISYRAVIRNNTVTGNGEAHAEWLYGAGIFVSASKDVEVYGNTVTNNARGIGGVMQDRGSGSYGLHTLENLYVHDNVVTMTNNVVDRGGQGTVTGVGQDIGDNSYFTSRGNRFERNTYYLGTAAQQFEWMNNSLNAAGWKSYGQDVTGTFIK
jgi:parallel beta-helix repeat protein